MVNNDGRLILIMLVIMISAVMLISTSPAPRPARRASATGASGAPAGGRLLEKTQARHEKAPDKNK